MEFVSFIEKFIVYTQSSKFDFHIVSVFDAETPSFISSSKNTIPLVTIHPLDLLSDILGGL